MNQKFGKDERIYLRDDIKALFKSKESHFVYPFKLAIVYPDIPNSKAKARILISVPAKKYKRAFLRNRIKRLVRESYRRHKHLLWETIPEDKQVHIAFIFVGDPDMDYHKMEGRMIRTLESLKTKLIKF